MSPFEGAWQLAAQWPVDEASVAVVHRDGIDTYGDVRRVQRIASVSKPLSAWAVLVAAEEGSISLDDPVGQSGCTVRHLLAHAGGYPFTGVVPVGKPGTKRIYSNTGYDMLAAHVEAATDMPFSQYLHEAVFDPLGMAASELRGSCAKDVWSNMHDLATFVDELRAPRLISAALRNEAVTAQFPELSGVVPGIGSFDPCPWGLGVEIRGHKQPHWTGATNAASTFGHFGGIGTFLWVDPVADVACVMLAEREFDEWGMKWWPAFNDAVLECARAARHTAGGAG